MKVFAFPALTDSSLIPLLNPRWFLTFQCVRPRFWWTCRRRPRPGAWCPGRRAPRWLERCGRSAWPEASCPQLGSTRTVWSHQNQTPGALESNPATQHSGEAAGLHKWKKKKKQNSTGINTYPNFIITLQSFFLEFFHWGGKHKQSWVKTSWEVLRSKENLADPHVIQWGPGGWRWQWQVQMLQCAGRSLCWGPACSPSGHGPAESCTGRPGARRK